MFDGAVEEHELRLKPDGSAFACFTGERSHGGSISHYASSDGEDHHTRLEEDWGFSLRGRWTAGERKGDAATLIFETIRYRDCDPLSKGVALDAPFAWHCSAMRGIQKVGMDALACKLPRDLRRTGLTYSTVAVQGGERDGSWALRDEPTGRGASTFSDEDHPWLLIGRVDGTRGGIELRSRDDGEGRGHAGVEFTISQAELGPVAPRPASRATP
jgi:hypothetical protein